MRARPLRLVAIAGALAGLVLGGSSPPAAAAVPRAPAAAVCESLRDYNQLAFLVQFAAALAQKSNQDPDKIRNQYLLVLSPKLEAVTRRIARAADGALADLFTDQSHVFGQGADQLKRAGLNAAQVKALAAAPVDVKEIDRVLGMVDLDSTKLADAGTKFASKAGQIDLANAPGDQFKAYRQAGVACGIFPHPPVRCQKLLTAAEATAVLGAAPKVADQDGSCTFDAQVSNGQKRGLAVDVYASPAAYDNLVAGVSPQDVPGVAAAAKVYAGYNSWSGTTSCGRTLAARDARRTVVVSACLGDAPVETDVLSNIATGALARAGGN